MRATNSTGSFGAIPLEATSSRPIGLVMPISSIDNIDSSHWVEVKAILASAVEPLGRAVRLVSDDLDSGLIHARIVQNLLSDELVICDVSCRNPNVMFELGLRIAFDKPTVIIKDDVTPYSFDTSSIEHLEYPRDLRYSRIQVFQEKLRSKVQTGLSGDANTNTFLKHFGSIKVPTIKKEEVPEFEFLMDRISGIEKSIAQLTAAIRTDRVVYRRQLPDNDALGINPERIKYSDAINFSGSSLHFRLPAAAQTEKVVSDISEVAGVRRVEVSRSRDSETQYVMVAVEPELTKSERVELERKLSTLIVASSSKSKQA